MLAILKTGAAYLPLDPEYPADRIAFMLSDAGVSIMCADRAQADALPTYAGAVVDVAAVSLTAAASTEPRTNVRVRFARGSRLRRLHLGFDGASERRRRSAPRCDQPRHRYGLRQHRAVGHGGATGDAFVRRGNVRNMGTASQRRPGGHLPASDGARSDRFCGLPGARKVSVMFITTALFHVIARVRPGGIRADPHVARRR